MLLRSMLTGTARFQGSFGKWHIAEGTAFLYRRTSWDHAWAALFLFSSHCLAGQDIVFFFHFFSRRYLSIPRMALSLVGYFIFHLGKTRIW